MRTLQLLEVLRDARELGDVAFEQSVLEQLGLDVAYVKKRFGKRQPYKPWRSTGGDDDLDEDETIEEFRARCGREYRSWQERDWMEWINPLKAAPLDEIFKRHYTDAAISTIETRPHPLFSMIKKSLVDS